MGQKNVILASDLEWIGKILSRFGEYRFSDDLKKRMKALKLNNAGFGKRCMVSGETVRNWTNGRKLP